MNHIGDYTKQAVDRKNPFKVITDYRIETYACGFKRISYKETINPLCHAVCLASRPLGVLSLLFDVAMRAGLGSREYFFDANSGDLLGTSKLDSAQTAIDKGLEQSENGLFSEARRYFKMAEKLCEDVIGNGIMLFKLKDARNETNRMEEKKKERILQQEKQRRKRQMEELWNNAFNAEREGNVNKANELLRTCRELAQTLFQSSRENEFQTWVDKCCLKQDCNSLFNTAVELQDNANKTQNKELYEHALSKYQEAREKCEEALEKSYDKRFEDCITLIDEQIEEIKRQQIRIQVTNVQVNTDAHEMTSARRVTTLYGNDEETFYGSSIMQLTAE